MPEGIMTLEGTGLPAAAPGSAPGVAPAAAALGPDFDPRQLAPEQALELVFSSIDEEALDSLREAKQELEALSAEELADISDMVDYMIANPDEYDESLEQLLKSDAIDPGDLPPTYDETFLQLFNAVVKMAMGTPVTAPMEQQMQAQGFARGGLASLAAAGRHNDSMLAHITPGEAHILRARGGSGTINPYTGLPEFFLKKVFKGVKKAFKSIGKAVKKVVSSVGKVLKKAAPMILSVALSIPFGPIVGSALGSGLGTLIQGGSPGDALKAAFLGGVSGAAFAGVKGMIGGEGFMAGVKAGLPAGLRPGGVTAGAPGPDVAIDSVSGAPAGAAPLPAAQQALIESAAPSGATGATTSATTGATAGAVPGATSAVTAQPSLLASELVQSGAAPSSGNLLTNSLAAAKNTASKFFNFLSPSRAVPDASAVLGSADYASFIDAGFTPQQAFTQAQSAMTPGMISRYGPLALAGTGLLAATGGFSPQEVPDDLGVAGTLSDGNVETGMQRFERLYPELAAETRATAQQVGGYGVSQAPAEVATPSFFDFNLLAAQENPYGYGAMQSLAPVNFDFSFPAQEPLRMADGGVALRKSPVFARIVGALRRIRAARPAPATPAQRVPGGVGKMIARLREQRAAPAAPAAPATAVQNAVQSAASAVLPPYVPYGLSPFGFQDIERPTQSQFNAAQPAAAQFNPVAPSTLAMMPQGADSYLGYSPYEGFGQPAMMAQGGYPRRNGAINGPGTETSDSIPALLSDGEFVFTARAVRGAGNGNRRRGIETMYELMNRFEGLA